MIGLAVVVFGVLVLCLSAAKSYGAVLCLRILIGCFQCWVQAIGLYTPYWYQRNEVATRAGKSDICLIDLIGGIALFSRRLIYTTCGWVCCLLTNYVLAAYYSAATLSGAFSGLIAYGVQKNLNGVAGRKNWQWLFIIEGALAVAVGIVFWLLLPPYPDQIKSDKHWLFSPEEIALAKDRARCKFGSIRKCTQEYY